MGTEDCADPSVRWERLCRRFEDLIEGWVGATEVSVTKEWAQQLASMSMAAQRVAGLRAMLIEPGNGENTEGDHGEGETADTQERRHWAALAREEAESDEG